MSFHSPVTSESTICDHLTADQKITENGLGNFTAFFLLCVEFCIMNTIIYMRYMHTPIFYHQLDLSHTTITAHAMVDQVLFIWIYTYIQLL